MIIDTWTFVLLSSTAFIQQVQTLEPEFHKTKYYIYTFVNVKKNIIQNFYRINYLTAVIYTNDL
jgi:hypothetical protein